MIDCLRPFARRDGIGCLRLPAPSATGARWVFAVIGWLAAVPMMIAVGTEAAAQDVTLFEYREPSLVYGSRNNANPLHLTWDAACRAANPEPHCSGTPTDVNPQICLTGGTGAYRTGYGPGCWYTLTYTYSWGSSSSAVHYQMWAMPQVKCPPTTDGWSYDTASGKCRRYLLPRYQATKDQCVGNPVYPSDGSKRQSEEDFAFAAGSSKLRLARTLYTDSLVGYASALGHGWFLETWGRSLNLSNLSSTGNILATRGAGQTFALSAFATSTWKTTPYDGLEIRSTAGNWTLIDKQGGTVEVYDSTGRLLTYAENSGRVVTLTYSDSGTPLYVAPTAGLLIGVASGVGRDMSFTYNASGRLATASLGSTVLATYSYDASRPDLLVGVQFADGSSRAYLYEPALNPLLTPPSDASLLAWLLPGAPGPTPTEATYTGPTPITSIAQMLTGRASRSGITGIRDELGQRFATYSYDSNGRVVSEHHGEGSSNFSFIYGTPLAHSTVTDALGTSSTRNYINLRGILQLSSQSQAAGSGCAASTSSQTFDGNGNVNQRDDFNGYRSCYSSDAARNLEVIRVEGLSTASACAAAVATNAPLPLGGRKVSTQWHPDWKLAARSAEPGRIVTGVYNGQPDPFNGNALAACAPASALLPDGKPIAVLCKRVEQATTDTSGAAGFAAALQAGVAARQTSWTYNQQGQMLTEDGPRTDVVDVTSYAYYNTGSTDFAPGDLASVTNALGKVTSYPLYNKHGQVLRKVDPNAVVTDYSYDLRQRLTSVTVGGQSTVYTYDLAGQLKRVTQPNGAYVGYDYDAAHRLTATFDNRNNRIEYTLDNAGNRVSERVKDPAGSLRKQVGRSIDPLGRVQQITGRE